MQRIIELDSVPNLRDLGGLTTVRGERIIAGRLFRSGSLHEMTLSDRDALEALGVTIAIDLRSAWEQQQGPTEWPGRTIVSAPLAEDEHVAEIFRGFETGTFRDEDIADWWELTGVIEAPERSVGSIRKVFETLMGAEPDGAVLFHCRGGKDRTGVVAALVLAALGVKREEIARDFLLSNRGARERAVGFAERLNREFGSGLIPEALFSIAGVEATWLDGLFERLDDHFGSVEGYLSGPVGLGSSETERLRSLYLERF